MSDRFYELHLAGLTRQLPLCPVSEELTIASFVMLGDVQIVEACADELVKKVPAGVEYIVCPEAKAIPLAHAMALRMGIPYVVLRKRLKAYMVDPIVVEVQSITTAGKQTLILDGTDAKKLEHKKVLILDDVVSTGGSLHAVEQVLAHTSCQVVAKAAPLLEEGGYDGKDLIYLGILPVFKR